MTVALDLEKFIWTEQIVAGRKNPQRQKKFLHFCDKCNCERGYFVKTWDITRSDGLCISCTKITLGPAVNKDLCYVCNQKMAISNKRCGSCDSKEYRKNNLEKIREKAKINQQERTQVDVNFKLTRRLRSRLHGVLNGKNKAGSAVSDLGCSIKELKKHLESKFYPNLKTGEVMSWGNWTTDGWHIDHIVPLALFDLSDPKQLKVACNYTNLQPLWAEENLSKGDRFGF